jgi:hypothetical protein
VKVFPFETWAAQDSVATDGGNFCGLAIGPSSDEAIVRVGELVLQAGRSLPFASSGGAYTITRHSVPKNTFTEIAKLQILAFECEAELACEVARPTGTYSSSSVGVNVAASAWTTVADVVSVPFIGRRHAMVSLHNSDVSKIGMVILGRRYNASLRAVETATLVTINPGDYTGTTMAVHVGGTNDAECWHSLKIQAGHTGAVDAVVFVDVECIGEIGAR